MTDIITKIIAKLLGFYKEGYATFVILTPKRKLYHFLLRLNILRHLEFYRTIKQYLKHPIDTKTRNIITDQIEHFLAFGN